MVLMVIVNTSMFPFYYGCGWLLLIAIILEYCWLKVIMFFSTTARFSTLILFPMVTYFLGPQHRQLLPGGSQLYLGGSPEFPAKSGEVRRSPAKRPGQSCLHRVIREVARLREAAGRSAGKEATAGALEGELRDGGSRKK